MFRASVAFAELQARNRNVVGTERLQRGIDLGTLVELYSSQVRATSKTSYAVDVPDASLASAWIGDWEMAYDVAIYQAQAYARAVQIADYPTWTAVTAYYAGFFAARALHYAAGKATRSIRGVQRAYKGGVYDFSAGSLVSANVRTLHFTKQGGGGSHLHAWTDLGTLFRQLGAVPGLDLRSVLILDRLADLIMQPQSVSAFRNAINYSLETVQTPVKQWSTLLSAVADSADLENEIATVSTRRDEQRIELLMLGCLDLLRDLYAEYVLRASRPDRRRGNARAARIASDPTSATLLSAWI